MNTSNPTQNLYTGLQVAYDYFNAQLFEGKLQHCVISVRAQSKCYGYWAGARFSADINGNTYDEIALNPKTFANRTKEQVLSTLVHEMVHLWQHHHGNAPKTGYHNKQWAEKMKSLGLQPSTTGQEGGKETGPKCSHYILSDGLFFKEVNAFLSITNIDLYADIWGDTIKKKKSLASKTKFTCPDCESNAWAKPDSHLKCGDCDVTMYAQGE